MPVVRTDLRNTRENAYRLRFEQTAGISATNVQDAIEQVAVQPKTIVSTPVNASPYAVQAADTVLYVNTATPKTIQLPPGALRQGLALEIKDITGNANANNITITPNGAETIDGLAPLLVNINYGGWKLYPTATGWTTAP